MRNHTFKSYCCSYSLNDESWILGGDDACSPSETLMYLQIIWFLSGLACICVLLGVPNFTVNRKEKIAKISEMSAGEKQTETQTEKLKGLDSSFTLNSLITSSHSGLGCHGNLYMTSYHSEAKTGMAHIMLNPQFTCHNPSQTNIQQPAI